MILLPSRQPVGRVFSGSFRGIAEYDDFKPARAWCYPPQLYGWPIRFGRGCDEAGNRTVGVFTWAGAIIIATPRRLVSSTTPEFEAEFLAMEPPS